MTRRVLGPLGLYLLLSVLLFGIPVLGHFGTHVIASDELDSSQFMWFLAWWPHAVLHGLNPFVTHAIFYPDGFNLTWATAMPGPSIVLAPLTLAFGPAVTWNVLQLLSPALSAWTAYLLCRHLTGRTWPSLAGGYLFGFSPYMLTHLTGGPYLALVALLPLVILLVLKRLEGTISRGWFVAAMAACLTGEYLISGEVLATGTLFGLLALLLGYWLYPERRVALRALVVPLVGAYVATVVLISPFLYYFFFGHQYPPGATGFVADLTSFVIPPPLVALKTHGGTASIGSSTETYLGLPLVVLLLAFLWLRRRERVAKLLGLMLLAGVIAALGARLVVHGHNTHIPLPWTLFRHLPVLRYAIPVRFALFIALPAAIVLALWLAQDTTRLSAARRAIYVGLGVLALVFIVPAIGNSAWKTTIADPPFFQHHAYRAYLHPSDHVLTVPVWGPNERWVADAGFPFPLTNGYAGNPFPPSFTRYPTYETLLTGRLTSDYAAQLRRFIRDKHVTAIVVQQGYGGPWRQLFGTLGVRPIAVGGVLVYRLPVRV